MNNKTDFTYFLFDDDFVDYVSDQSLSREYLTMLKEKNPERAEEIDLAVKTLVELKRLDVSKADKETKERIWREIKSHSIRFWCLHFMRVAASFLVLASLGAAVFYFVGNRDKTATTGIESFARQNNPEYSQAQLLLSDGKQILISENESNIKYSGDGASVTVNDSTEITQTINENVFNQLIVSYGNYTSIVLSDGTRIWVNAGSRLVYPPVFVGNVREVFVEGEAYFEVAKDEKRPFYVKTDILYVRVTGTRFNVMASKEDDLFSVLLLEGGVSVSSVKAVKGRGNDISIEPGCMASLGDEMKSFMITRPDSPENLVAWRNGYLIFNNEPLQEVVGRISKFYNIEIEISVKVESLRVTGKLDLKSDPERVLRGVAAIAKCNLVKNGVKYTFM